MMMIGRAFHYLGRRRRLKRIEAQLRQTGLFNDEWYAARYPDAAGYPGGVVKHYVRWGMTEGRRPGLGFDPVQYAAHHDIDVRTSNAMEHYLQVGRHQNYALLPVSRSGDDVLEAKEKLAQSTLFWGDWYMQQNKDVIAAGADPLEHYIAFGADQGRSPNPFFDGRWYRGLYLGPNRSDDPLGHYIDIGAKENYAPSAYVTSDLLASYRDYDGEAATPLAALIAAYTLIERSWLFDKDWYLSLYKDVTAIDPLVHFMLFGSREGRQPNRFFATGWYLAAHPEAAAFPNALLYYIHQGAARGNGTCPWLAPMQLPGVHNRADPLTALGRLLKSWRLVESSGLFDPDWYLEEYPKAAATGGNPLSHFMLHGVGEALNPNRLFDTAWYLSQYPEVEATGLNPLAHYIETGAAKGYLPHPFFPAAAAATSVEPKGKTPLREFLLTTCAKDPGAFPVFGPYDVYRKTRMNDVRLQEAEILQHIALMVTRPKFTILIDGSQQDDETATRDSLALQYYPDFDSRTIAGMTDLHITASPGEFLLILRSGDILRPDALYSLASVLNEDPTLDLVTFDHEIRSSGGLHHPLHKPAWSPDLLEAYNYIDTAACYRATAVAGLAAHATCLYDFLLRVTERPLAIQHIPRVLMEMRSTNISDDEGEERNRAALAARVTRTGRTGSVSAAERAPKRSMIDLRLRSAPLVSIVIATGGRTIEHQGKKIDLVRQCVSAISQVSTYKRKQFVIVDGGDLDRGRLREFAGGDMTFVSCDQAELNLSRKFNLGVATAHGDVIVTLHDDVVPIAPDWIERMLAHLEKPHVGMVGARLIDPDGKLQHVGIVASDGHFHRIMAGMPSQSGGYEDAARTVRNYLAVTGAAAMTRRALFLEAGGYDELFPVDYNDIDLCLRLRAMSYSIVYEPSAELRHHQAGSVKNRRRPSDAEVFYKRWPLVAADRYYNQYAFDRRTPLTYDLRYSSRELR